MKSGWVEPFSDAAVRFHGGEVHALGRVGRALEHHVLEQVGEAGAALLLRARADVVNHVDGDHRDGVVLRRGSRAGRSSARYFSMGMVISAAPATHAPARSRAIAIRFFISLTLSTDEMGKRFSVLRCCCGSDLRGSDGRLQLDAWSEMRHSFGGDLHGTAASGIANPPCFAVSDTEGSQTRNDYPVPVGQAGLDAVDDGVSAREACACVNRASDAILTTRSFLFTRHQCPRVISKPSVEVNAEL